MAGKFYRFCQLTSVKGVPRLLRTESVIMRFVWTISVIVLLCLALLQTTFLTMEYLHYKTYTFTGEVKINNLGHEDGTTGVPDITLCNANPFASDRNLSKDVPTMAKYFELVEQSTMCGNGCKEDEILALKHIRNDMINAESYFNYIGRHTAEKLGHTFESFFAYCEVDMRRSGYGMLRHVPCLTTKIIQIQHTTHYNCYTIRADQNEFPDKVLPGFLVVLHLDEYGAIDNEQSMLNPHKIPGHISGVWIFAHQQNKPLYDNYQRMLLQPGHFHDIPVNVVQRTYLPPPHGHCENMDGQEYSMTLCHNQCIRAYVYEKCGCLELVNYTSPWRPIENEGPPCFSVSLKKNGLIKNWNCVMEEIKKRLDECESSCPEPCSEMRYKLRSSQTTWPVSTINEKFYDLYIANRSYEEYYRSFFEHRNESDQHRELHERIRKHFLVAHVYLETGEVLDIRDKPQFTATAFLSQLGGALNLWAGITVVIVVELIELCYEMIVDRFYRKSSEDMSENDQKQQA